jgi:hypothetical protein
MNATLRWLTVGLLVLTVGCNKGEPAGSAGGGAGGYGAAPSKPPVDVAPDVYVQGVINSALTGDAGAVWNALPAKYQADVKSLKDEFAGKVDAEMWNKGFEVVGKLGRVLRDKKDFILAGALGGFLPAESKEPIKANWDSVVGLLNTLATSEIKTVDGLKQADPGRFLSSTGTAVLSGGLKAAAADKDAAEKLAKARTAKVILDKHEGDTATLKLEVDGKLEPEVKEFKKIDGKWLPADMIADWDKGVADMKNDMSSLAVPPEQKLAVMGMLASVDQLLDKLLAAKDQAAFDGEVGMAMMQFGPLLGGLGGGGGAMSGPPVGLPPGGAPSASGFDGPSFTPPIVPPTITPPPVTPPKAP